MNDESMTKEQLLDELNALRKEVDRFRKAEAERERYVKELKETARFLAGVLEASPIVFTITRRKDGRFLLVNPAHDRESGYSPEEVLGKTSLELNMYVNKADRDAFVKILEETEELNNFEVQYRNKDGSVRDVLLYARPLVYAGEECMLTASLPITERKRAEQKITKYRDHLGELVKERTAQLESEITVRKRAEDALRESKENLDKAQKITHIGNWSRDLNLNRAQWSDEIYRNLGLTPGDPAEPSFETFLSRVHPEDRERVTSVLKEAAEKKQAFDFEFRTTPIEGSERIIRNRGEVEYDETGNPVRLFGTAQDITETRRLQAQVQESQKIEAIATLAGGIAHQFNNALTPIIGHIDLLKMKHGEDENTKKSLKDMKKSGHHMAHLTSQLLAYAE
ncbi:MAG: PAS domain-containing protein, partial [Desulfobacteraceae bacterium]|nr:PAS domain-containing protein [Desulfobacteraceae bacterium]